MNIEQRRTRIAKAFGIVLRELRMKANLSQESLANISLLHRTTIGLMERGLRSPSLDTVFRLSEALNISPDQFIIKVKKLFL